MRKFPISVFMFFAGLLIGAGTVLIAAQNGPAQGDAQNGPAQVVASQWNQMVEINVVYATLLHDQKYSDLDWLINTNMVAGLDGGEKLGFVNKDKPSARLVRGYYDMTGTTPPALIAPYLSGVRGTDVRRLAEVMSRH
jgi:hypothetical protein